MLRAKCASGPLPQEARVAYAGCERSIGLPGSFQRKGAYGLVASVPLQAHSALQMSQPYYLKELVCLAWEAKHKVMGDLVQERPQNGQ